MRKSIGSLVIVFLLCFQSGICNGQSNEDYVLPKVLETTDGKTVKNKRQWENIRRSEILELFKTHVYGSVPEGDVKVSYSLKKMNKNALGGKAIQKEVIATFTNGEESLEMNMLIFLPNNTQKPVPVFLGLNFFGNQTIHASKEISLPTSYIRNNENFFITNNTATEESRGIRGVRWPVERIIERGYGLVAIYYGDIDPDFDDDFQNGIHKLFHEDNEQPKPNEWGSIAAWSYGLSKAMDYLETDKSIDKNKVAVIGHSRLGKTSLWAGATDQRFALTISNDSGCGGAALSRRKEGETVKKINDRFPHWFNDNFTRFNDNEDELPVDQHMLISLMAPRPVYVASAAEDQWADPEGEYLSVYHAGPVYELYGLDSFKSDKSPEIDQPRMVDNLGYHIRTGKHNLTYYDWEKYMDFADIHF